MMGLNLIWVCGDGLGQADNGQVRLALGKIRKPLVERSVFICCGRRSQFIHFLVILDEGVSNTGQIVSIFYSGVFELHGLG